MSIPNESFRLSYTHYIWFPDLTSVNTLTNRSYTSEKQTNKNGQSRVSVDRDSDLNFDLISTSLVPLCGQRVLEVRTTTSIELSLLLREVVSRLGVDRS